MQNISETELMTRSWEFDAPLPDPQPYIEKALALYQRAVREKRGRIIFITAESGGGKTELLDALAKALYQEKPRPNFAAAYFRNEECRRYSLDWQKKICLKRTALAIGSIASLLGLGPIPTAGIASLVGQSLEAGVSTRELVEEFKQKPLPGKDGAYSFRNSLRQATEEQPLVCLLDNWDEAERLHWDVMLLNLSREIAQDLPLLLFITIKEPLNLNTPEKDETGLAYIIKRLTDKGLAELWPLRKLSKVEVAAAIGSAAPGIAAKLHGVTGGNARWVRELWREWRLAELVVTDETDRWVWREDLQMTTDLYKDILPILGERLTRLLKDGTAMEVDAALNVLACAALEGESFTARAVARALGWNEDELINFLDDSLVQSEENPDGLLSEDDGITISGPDGTTDTLWRYSFVSDLHRAALLRYGFAGEQQPESGQTERAEMSEALAEALLEVYSTEEQLVAEPLARLWRESGHEEQARHYQRMATSTADRDVMREQALYVLALDKGDWEQWQCRRTARFLIEAGRMMLNAFSYAETLAVFEEACTLARRAKDRQEEAYAQYHCGTTMQSEGEYKLARERANESLRIFQLIETKSGIAASLYLLALIERDEGRLAEAQAWATQSLKIYQEIEDHRAIAALSILLGWIYHPQGKLVEARVQALQALKLCQEIGDRKGISIALNSLSRIDRDEGKLADARARTLQALEIQQERRDSHEIAISLHSLAQIDRDEGRLIEARALALQALEIDQEIGNSTGIAIGLNLLGELDRDEGKLADARARTLQALEILQEMGDQYEVAISLLLLAQIDYDEEKFLEARARALQALKIQQGIGAQIQIATLLNLLTKIDLKEGKLVEARARTLKALEIQQGAGDQKGITVSLNLLAQVDLDGGKLADARDWATQALRLEQGIGDQIGVASALTLLVRIDIAEEKLADARERAIKLLVIHQEFGNQHQIAAGLGLLSLLAYQAQLPKEALTLASLSSLIYTQIGDASMHSALSDLTKLVTEPQQSKKQQYTEEELQELFRQVSEAYTKDGGTELIEQTLAILREAIT
jgi:tetratricopeptide (TPR) repeat protein